MRLPALKVIKAVRTISQLAITHQTIKYNIMKTDVFHPPCYTIRDALVNSKFGDQIDLGYTISAICSICFQQHFRINLRDYNSKTAIF